MSVRSEQRWWSVFAGLALTIASTAPAGAATLEDVIRLFAADAAADDKLGVSVDIDGDTLVVGASFDDDQGIDSGSAYVFIRSGGSWTQQAKLVAADGAAGDVFGQTVSVSGDTILVGAPDHDSVGSYTGAAYVFVRSGSSWTQQAKLLASDANPWGQFGWNVDLDGDTAVIGAISDFTGSTQTGSAYVFSRSGTTWSEQAKLLAPDGASGDFFGASVAVSGNTAAVGAPADDDAGDGSGSVYVFIGSGGSWSLQAKLAASDAGPDARFGRVAIDGDRMIVGSYGAAYVFARSGSTWSEETRLTASDGHPGDAFGLSVALDGDTVVVGAPTVDGEGSVYVFRREAGSWVELLQLDALPDSEFAEWMGWSVAIQGELGAAGAPFHSQVAFEAGSLVTFRIADAPADSDGDGLPDDRDPDTVADVVTGIDSGSFSAPGHSTAILSRLSDVEAMIFAGDIEGAIRQLENLLRRLDGCPDIPTAGESADRNDWITDCDDQRAVRNAILALIAALRA